jgi:hypothetical protein
MRQFLLICSLVLSFVQGFSQSIVQYRVSTLNGQQLVMAIYSDGSRKQVASLPPDAVRARVGGLVRLPYAPEPKQTFNPGQFGANKYYSPSFKFSADFNPNDLTVNQMKQYGQTLFNWWLTKGDDKLTLQEGDGMAYVTESGLHGPLEGAGYFESTLADYEAYVFNHLPACGYGNNAGIKYVIFNLEQSNDWNRGNYANNGKWPSWEAAKNRSVKCEFDGNTRTLEQIDQQGLWGVEASVRRGNRRLVCYQAARMRAAYPIFIADGSSMYQGLPRMDFRNLNNVFLNSGADVSHIGGSNGQITLNGRTYTDMYGSQWSHEDFMLGYYYLFGFEMYNQDYQDIFVNQVAGKTNYPYLWGKVLLRHIVADEKGYLQLNRRLMVNNQGHTRPIMRMIEPVYEGAGHVIETGQSIDRLTWPELQPNVTGDYEPPKTWQAPWLNYSRYVVTRFFAGNEPGWGLHLFPIDPSHLTKEKTLKQYNFHWHALAALWQARADMQPYENYYTGSTLVEDPEVQENGSGGFTAWTGVEAYNYSDGTIGTQHPSYMLRYKPVAGGWRVLIMGGMNQNWTQERTDIIRVPGALNGNVFRVKLRGPAAQVYEFSVKSTDSNQTYEAVPNANVNFERAGYAGRTSAN